MTFDILLVIQELNEMLSCGIVDNYALGGAVAATIFIEAIDTHDVDVFVHFKSSGLILDPSPILNYFKARGYEMREDGVMIGGWPVQFLPPASALEEAALMHCQILESEGVTVRVFSPEYLAAICLRVGRAKDKARIEEFWKNDALDIPAFEEIVSRHGLAEKWLDFKSRLEP